MLPDSLSIVPYFVIMVMLIGLGALLARGVPFYRALLAAPPARFEMLDGLRGVMALSVFIHHAVVTFAQSYTGAWQLPPWNFYVTIGPVGLRSFFMMTGLLFWDKVLERDGRLDTVALFSSRVRRIMPLYLFSLSCVVLVAFWRSGWVLRESPGKLFLALMSWLSFGLTNQTLPINGVADSWFIPAGVYWSLHDEWRFYLALPFLALFRRPLPFVGMLLVLGVWQDRLNGDMYARCFAAGMGIALLLRRGLLPPIKPVWLREGLAVAALLTAWVLPHERHLAQFAAATALFALVAQGASLCGLLRSRPARWLGTVSYSIYLLHGIVLYLSVRALPPLRELPLTQMWLWLFACGAVTLVISAATFRWIEHPFMARKTAAPPDRLDPASGHEARSTGAPSRPREAA
jgi:peptidoglycan/LPS O-acetylase OafA/YrhL